MIIDQRWLILGDRREMGKPANTARQHLHLAVRLQLGQKKVNAGKNRPPETCAGGGGGRKARDGNSRASCCHVDLC